MMKKMLILIVVLALSTSASAVMVSAVSGGSATIDVAPGATVVVDLVSDTLCTALMDTGTAGWWVTADSGIGLPTNGTFDSSLDQVTSDALSRLYAGTSSGTAYIDIGDSIFQFSVTAPTGLGTYDVDMNVNSETASFFDELGAEHYDDLVQGGSLAITVIPEPMTIALLGLGGLFLRRKK